MVIDISKITLENIDDYAKIGEYKKGKHYTEFEKEIYKKEREKQQKERQRNYYRLRKNAKNWSG